MCIIKAIYCGHHTRQRSADLYCAYVGQSSIAPLSKNAVSVGDDGGLIYYLGSQENSSPDYFL